MGKLDGKIALVTGGNSGIGLASAKRLAADGAFVFITGRRQGELDAAVKEIGTSAYGVQGDVSKPKDLERLAEVIRSEKGHLDILFANAGVAEFAPLGGITEKHYDAIFDTNVKGLVFTVQAVLPLIPAGGTIIINASNISVKGGASFSIYAATKAAVRSLARSWTLDLKERNIRVNAVSPGPIGTPGLNGLGEGVGDYMRGQVPIGRLGDPAEVAGVVSFLASDESSFMAGAEVFVDGGLSQV